MIAAATLSAIAAMRAGFVKASVILVQVNVSPADDAARPLSLALPIVSASVESDDIGSSIERGSRCAR